MPDPPLTPPRRRKGARFQLVENRKYRVVPPDPDLVPTRAIPGCRSRVRRPLYHDSVLHRAASSLPAPLRPPSSSHTRYTRHFVTNSQPYNILAHTLSVVQSLELLIEMAVTKRGGGRDKAEKTVIAIEAIKAALRLGLMGATKGRTGVQPPVAEREMDPALLAMNQERLAKMQRAATKLHHGTEATAAPPPHSAADVLLRQSHGETSLQIGMAKVETEREDEPEFWTGPRTGYVRPTLASLRRNGDATPLGDATVTLTASYMAKDVGKEYLMSRVLTVEDVRRPEDLVSKAKGIKKLAEIIYILRPLIYVIAMRRYGRRHTLPYLLSLALEYLAYSLRCSSTSRLATNKASGPMLPVKTETELEKQETSKRARQFWWYLVRGPVWEGWTKPRLEAIAGKFQDKPLIGFVSTLLQDYVPLIDEYYYYTA
ncbi:Peroxisomal membrane protein pex16 [Rhodotorula mucilaginosa]|uniref:Peroxisomal membrane protein PEX16 n=1 Tax=Rhodotorula mucilaginosa TaxID=5537 RepID=A0A9P6VZR2_RHOMI|nr:Peroxisomal membrane protein pex16 [Rhodotorula mucilaginosa]